MLDSTAAHSGRASLPMSPAEVVAGSPEAAHMAEGQSEPLVRYQALVRLEFTKDLAEMSTDELLQAAREVRVLRFIRSMDTRNPIYQRLVAMERALAAQYFQRSEAPPSGWQPGDVFDQNMLFSSRQDFLRLFDEFQVRVDRTPPLVLPEHFEAPRTQSTPQRGVEEHAHGNTD